MVNYIDSLRGAVVVSGSIMVQTVARRSHIQTSYLFNPALNGYIVGIGEGLGSEWRGICYFD